MLNKNRLFHRFYSYPALTFDVVTMNDGTQFFIDPPISTMEVMIDNASIRSEFIVEHLHCCLERHPAESCIARVSKSCNELDRDLCSDT